VDTYAADVARAPDCSCHNIAHTKPCRRWTRWATKSRTSRKGTRRRETESWEDTWWPVRRNENKRTEQLRARRGYGQPVASGGREGIPRQSTSPGRRFRRAVNDEPFDPSNIIGKRILVARWTTPLAPFKLGFYISRSDFTSLPCLVERQRWSELRFELDRHAPDWQDMRDFFSNVIHLRSPARDLSQRWSRWRERSRAKRHAGMYCAFKNTRRGEGLSVAADLLRPTRAAISDWRTLSRSIIREFYLKLRITTILLDN